MSTFITIIHVVTCILLVLVIMIQSGKGAEISASFGGSSQTVFGSSGGANFFVKFTGVAAAVFMCTSLALTVLGSRSNHSVFESMAVPAGATAPAKPVTAPANPAAPAAGTPAQPSAGNTAPATGANNAGASTAGAAAGANAQQQAPAAPAAPQTK